MILQIVLSSTTSFSQSILKGNIVGEDGPLANVLVYVEGTDIQSQSDKNGNFILEGEFESTFILKARMIGYRSYSEEFTLSNLPKSINIKLNEDLLNLEEVVVSASRYELDRKEAPVLVNVISPRLLEASQSVSLSEGLDFQPGVRVETNCQNCGFTQVRLNGLEGAYSQVLVNSRAVFSSLNAVYGLEQIPSNTIERVEVVRGGGSALYGSNAIAGTINIITKEPVANTWEIKNNTMLIGGESVDNSIGINSSLVSNSLRSGITVFALNRNREAFDANGDGFTELTELKSNAVGTKAFYKVARNTKLNVDLSYLNEYRRGGDRLDIAPELTDITEELLHNTLFYGLSLDQNLGNRKNHKLSFYHSGQLTERDSYYGGLGGGRSAEDSLLAVMAYGQTSDRALLTGVQYVWKINRDVLSIGAENQNFEVIDEIEGYNRSIDQRVITNGVYAQYEWNYFRRLRVLSGLRYDNTQVNGDYNVGQFTSENQVNMNVFSPRLTAMYDLYSNLKIRASYARGFRAPQAFDEDLHIASVGGEQRFAIPGDNLEKESSNAYTLSLNYFSNDENYQLEALIEGFYTEINNPFILVNTGRSLDNGSILDELQNGNGAVVQGMNMEINYSPNNSFLFQGGATFQNSNYREEQVIFESEEGNLETREFLRNPNLYAYFASRYKFNEDFSIDLTGTGTGNMKVAKVINSGNDVILRETDPFYNINIKLAYHIDFNSNFHLELAGGIKNVFNSYQNDFDSGPERDSNYIYGPAAPRTYFLSLKIGNIH